MSEIEKIKLYQNAGIEPTYTDECIIANRYWGNKELANEYGTFDKFMEKNCEFGYQDCTDECGYAYTKTHYPPFTAEKQLEITKFLLKKAVYYDVKDDKYWFYYEECESAGYKPFDEAIAHFINKLWADMSEADKQQVKGILE